MKYNITGDLNDSLSLGNMLRVHISSDIQHIVYAKLLQEEMLECAPNLPLSEVVTSLFPNNGYVTHSAGFCEWKRYWLKNPQRGL